MDISIIILNYKSERYLSDCLSSIQKHSSDLCYEIIIVNNDSTALTNVWPNEHVVIINNNSNVGFAKACNKGAVIAKSEILFFLNPDTEIKHGNISELISTLSDPSIGIVAPQLILPSGNVQPWSLGYNINMWDIICNNFGYVRSMQLWRQGRQASVEPAWVSGGALTIRKSLFDELTGFDENFFMYFEDVDLCKRVSNFGKKICLLPDIRILHFGGQSFSSTKIQKTLYYASQDYYFKKHFGFLKLFILKVLREISSIFKR